MVTECGGIIRPEQSLTSHPHYGENGAKKPPWQVVFLFIPPLQSDVDTDLTDVDRPTALPTRQLRDEDQNNNAA